MYVDVAITDIKIRIITFNSFTKRLRTYHKILQIYKYEYNIIICT